MDATNGNTALASALVEELARCGVRHAVLSPGSRSSPLALALWREPAIEVTVVVDERSAGFFALGAAQASGVPVAVLTTSGTAAANLHPAVCEADQSAIPLLVLTADRPPELRDVGAGQTIDQLKLYGEAARWFCEVGTHDADDRGLLHLRAVACRAFAAARGDHRPGPVHLNLSWRDPLGPEPRAGDVTAGSALALEGRGDRPLTTVPAARAAPAPALADALAERVEGAARGLILAGRMADPAAAPAIAALARASGYPVLAEPTSQLRLGGHDRELVVWAYEPVARAAPPQLAPELVLRFGELPTCKPLRLWLERLEDTAQLAIDPAHGWHEPTRHAGAIVRAEAGPLALAVAERLGRPPDGGWAGAWLAAAEAAARAIEERLEAFDVPTEPGLQAALGRLYADGELVYTASSMPIRDQEAFVASGPAAARFLANRGANGIDGLISSGIGAAVATGSPAWIVTGDLGLLHDLNALALAGEAPGPLRIVIVDNGGGGIFDFLPQAEQVGREEFEAILGTPRPIDLARAAGAFGLRHERVERLEGLAAAAAGDGPVLIEVPVPDRERNVELHGELAQAAVAAVREAIGEETR